MKTIPPPQKPEVKSAQQAPKPHRAPSRSTYNCTATYLPNFFFRRMANFPPKTKNKNKRKQPEHDKPGPSTTYRIDPQRRASKHQKHSILSHCPVSSSQLCIMMYVWYLYPIYVLPSKQEEGNSDGAYLRVGLVNWGAKSGKKGGRSKN